MLKYLVVLGLLAGPAAADAVVAIHTMRSMSVITRDDIEIIPDDIPGAAISADEVVGMEAKVMLYGGRPIRPDQVASPALVERNQVVSLIYVAGGLTIAAEGRALARAALGDELRVLNLGSKKTVTGVVLEDGSVAVGLQ